MNEIVLGAQSPAERPVGQGSHPPAELPPKGHQIDGLKVNWDEVRRTYVHGLQVNPGEMPCFPSLVEVANLFGLHADTVKGRSASEGWVADRETFRKMLRKELNEEMLKIALDHAGQAHAQAFQNALLGMKKAGELISTSRTASDLNAIAVANGRFQQQIQQFLGEARAAFPEEAAAKASSLWSRLRASWESDVELPDLPSPLWKESGR